MRHCWLVLVILGAGIGIPAFADTPAPSFDCQKASTVTENIICSSEDLSKLDRDVATLYRQTRDLIAGEDLQRLISEQRKWVAQRDRECLWQLRGGNPEESLKPIVQ